MANRDVFPTENWRWPDTYVCGACGTPTRARYPGDGNSPHGDVRCPVCRPLDPLSPLERVTRDRDDWKAVAERRMQERDELMEALDRALERSAPERLLAAVERDELAQDRALLARIKGGG